MMRMMGDSRSMANAKATPYAARLNLGSARRAITAAMKGPSRDIIIHVEARGHQNWRIRLWLSGAGWFMGFPRRLAPPTRYAFGREVSIPEGEFTAEKAEVAEEE